MVVPAAGETPERRPPVTLAYDRTLTPEWLRDRYITATRSVEELAREAGACTQTIRRALDRHQIPVRERDRTGIAWSLGDVLTEELLRDAYETHGRSVRSIATEHGCSEAAVMARLRRYNIPRRGVQQANRLILADILDTDTLRQRRAAGQTPAQIAKDLHVDPGSVRSYLRRHGLE